MDKPSFHDEVLHDDLLHLREALTHRLVDFDEGDGQVYVSFQGNWITWEEAEIAWEKYKGLLEGNESK